MTAESPSFPESIDQSARTLDRASRLDLGLRANTATPSPQELAMRLVFDGPDSGTALVRSFSGSSVPPSVEVRFEPANPSDRLIGEPPAWCNSPGGGETLVFSVPVPTNPGDPDTTGTLKVRTSGSTTAAVRIPITVKHEI